MEQMLDDFDLQNTKVDTLQVKNESAGKVFGSPTVGQGQKKLRKKPNTGPKKQKNLASSVQRDNTSAKKEQRPAKKPNCQVVWPGPKSRYKRPEESFQFPKRKKSDGTWVLSDREIDLFWKQAGSLPVPTDNDWLIGNFVREGCLSFGHKEMSKTGTLTFGFGVSVPQNWNNMHILIAYKRLFGVGDIAVKSGKTMRSGLVYRCSNPADIYNSIQPVQGNLAFFVSKKSLQLEIFRERLELYMQRQRDKNYHKFTPMSVTRQEGQYDLRQSFKSRAEKTVYLPKQWGKEWGLDLNNLPILSPARISGYSQGDYSQSTSVRKNSFRWTVSFFREKTNAFMLLQINQSFRKIYNVDRDQCNYTPAGVFRDQSREKLLSNLQNLHCKGVDLRYTSIEGGIHWLRHFKRSPNYRAGSEEQLALIETQMHMRLYCRSVKDYSPLSSLQRVFEPFLKRHSSPSSRRIVLQSIRKSLGLKQDRDQAALIPEMDTLRPTAPAPPIKELKEIFNSWKAEYLQEVEKTQSLRKRGSIKQTKKRQAKAESHQVFISAFEFIR